MYDDDDDDDDDKGEMKSMSEMLYSRSQMIDWSLKLLQVQLLANSPLKPHCTAQRAGDAC